MNPETISQVFFSSAFTVAPAHTAAALFATLPQGARHANRMAPMLNSAALLAQLQAVCVDALQTEIYWTRETVVGTSVRLEYTGYASAGETVNATGFVVGVGDSSLAFQVDACVGGIAVATGTLCFAIVERMRPEGRAILRASAHDDVAGLNEHSFHATSRVAGAGRRAGREGVGESGELMMG